MIISQKVRGQYASWFPIMIYLSNFCYFRASFELEPGAVAQSTDFKEANKRLEWNLKKAILSYQYFYEFSIFSNSVDDQRGGNIVLLLQLVCLAQDNDYWCVQCKTDCWGIRTYTTSQANIFTRITWYGYVIGLNRAALNISLGGFIGLKYLLVWLFTSFCYHFHVRVTLFT